MCQAEFALSSFCLWLWLRMVHLSFESFLAMYKVIQLSCLLILVMIVCAPVCHSFVRRGKDDLAARFDARVAPNFNLPESGNVSLFGTRGRQTKSI